MTSPSAAKVSFSSTNAVISAENDRLAAKHFLWYSRKETSSMKRECKVLSKHYKRLNEHQHYNKDDMIGLEDARISREKASRRRLAVQSILLQQDIHRALKLDDPIKIGTIAEAYSKLACTQARQRAQILSTAIGNDKSIASLVLSEQDNEKSAYVLQPQPASKATETPPPVVSFTHSRVLKAIVPVYNLSLKGELPQQVNHRDLQRKQLIETPRSATKAAPRMRATLAS